LIKIKFTIFAAKKQAEQLRSIVRSFGYHKPLLFIDKNLQKSFYLTKILHKLKNFKKYFVSLKSEPSYDDLNEFLKLNRKSLQKVDVVIAIGGGSLLDFAKGIAVLFANKGPAEKYKGFPKIKNPPIPLIALPSTAGTGSEITFNASFVDLKTHEKMGINAINNYPVATILDPYLCVNAPFKNYSSTGCDALVHAIESFLSPRGTVASKELSRTAFKLISNNFDKILTGSKNTEIWLEMQWASVFSMMALSNSSSGPTGAFSYYLGPIHKVPHGIAGAFFLRHVLKITYRHKDKTLERLSNDKSPVLNEIFKILDLAKIPKTLNGLGINDFDKNKFFEFSKKVSAARKLHSIPFTMKMVEELVEEIS